METKWRQTDRQTDREWEKEREKETEKNMVIKETDGVEKDDVRYSEDVFFLDLLTILFHLAAE